MGADASDRAAFWRAYWAETAQWWLGVCSSSMDAAILGRVIGRPDIAEAMEEAAVRQFEAGLEAVENAERWSTL